VTALLAVEKPKVDWHWSACSVQADVEVVAVHLIAEERLVTVAPASAIHTASGIRRNPHLGYRAQHLDSGDAVLQPGSCLPRDTLGIRGEGGALKSSP